MNNFVVSAIIALTLCASNTAEAQYLGQLSSNPYAANSTSNPYGQYGSPYSPNSINNPYGTYGSPYSNQSPNNPYATSPPSIYGNGSIYGRR